MTERDMIGYRWDGDMEVKPKQTLPRFTQQEMRILGFHGVVTSNPSINSMMRWFR